MVETMRLTGLAVLVGSLAIGCRGFEEVAPPIQSSPATRDAGFGPGADASRLDAGHTGGDTRGDTGGIADATQIADADLTDTTRGDASVSADATINLDAATGADAGAPPTCDEVTFAHVDGNASTVWVTGSFTSWGATPSAGAIELTRSGNDSWSVTTSLGGRGQHQYKFIIDGTNWIEDPNSSERASDGFGGFNSAITVCEGGLTLLTHATDQAGRRFTATLEYQGADDPSSAVVTVDMAAAPASSVAITGSTIQLDVQGLADGIHDVRVTVGSERVLLKVYINETTDWRDTVIYFAMTDRFINGDANNDAPLGGTLPLADYMGGDFAGITQAINDGYFDRLGANALWITWPADNPDGGMDGVYPVGGGCNPSGFQTGTFSAYHGYWPKSGRDIEARFGTMAELQALVSAAHARGIRILLDFTANHMHTDSDAYLNHANDWFNQPAIMCGDGHWDDHLREECWFEPYLADWKHSSPDARRQVIDDAIWMVEETGADGFRVDALKHMDDALAVDLRARLAREIELTGVPFYMVGETFTGDTGLINHYVNPQMVHAQFDFPANQAIREALARNDIGVDEMHRRVRGIKAAYGASAPLMSTFIGNHDIARFISKATGELGCGIWAVLADRVRAFDNPPSQPTDGAPYRRLELAMAYSYGVVGIPLIYYGDEVGLAGAGDPDNRRMLPEAASLNSEQRRSLDFMQRLGQTRQTHAVLRRGDWTDALWADTTLLVFARTLPNSKALIVINRGAQRTISVDLASIGAANGAQFDAVLGQGTLAVNGTSTEITVGTLAAEIYISR